MNFLAAKFTTDTFSTTTTNHQDQHHQAEGCWGVMMFWGCFGVMMFWGTPAFDHNCTALLLGLRLWFFLHFFSNSSAICKYPLHCTAPLLLHFFYNFTFLDLAIDQGDCTLLTHCSLTWGFHKFFHSPGDKHFNSQKRPRKNVLSSPRVESYWQTVPPQ